jgi:hypothetical protein
VKERKEGRRKEITLGRTNERNEEGIQRKGGKKIYA